MNVGDLVIIRPNLPRATSPKHVGIVLSHLNHRAYKVFVNGKIESVLAWRIESENGVHHLDHAI